MRVSLETLLARIRDGQAGADELVRAGELARLDARIPDELKPELFGDDPPADAAGLLALLGADAGFAQLLREALVAEAGTGEDAVVEQLTSARAAARELPLTAGNPPATPVSRPRELVSAGESAREFRRTSPAEADPGEQVGSPSSPASAMDDSGGELGARLREALAREAGDPPPVWPGVATAIGLPVAGADLAVALRRGAGSPPSVWPGVAAAVGLSSVEADLATALRREAGDPPSLWPAVAAGLGLGAAWAPSGDAASAPSSSLAWAIRREAGTVDVVAAVMAELDRGERRAPAPPDGFHTDLRAPAIPPRANTGGWSWAALVMAAVALLVVGVQRLAPSADPREIAGLELGATLTFASSGEVIVEDLEYSEHVQVIQAEGDQGALILWVDEEAVL